MGFSAIAGRGGRRSIRRRHFPVETWFCRGAAAEEIVRVTEEIGCDLIVMGTHGRTGLERS